MWVYKLSIQFLKNTFEHPCECPKGWSQTLSFILALKSALEQISEMNFIQLSFKQIKQNTKKHIYPKTHLQRKPWYFINSLKHFFIPSRAWKSWLPRMADTLPTLFFKVCSSGLVRSAWYLFRSPTALSVSASQKNQTCLCTAAAEERRFTAVRESIYILKNYSYI